MIEDLFELSVLEAGEKQPNIDAVDLRLLIDSLIAQLSPKAEELGVELAASYEGTPGAVLADELMLARVLSNLTENALRFCAAGDSVLIEVLYAEHRAEVRVVDTGCGMSQEEAEHSLLAFRQVDAPEMDRPGNRTHSGAGLGLTIVQRIVELHESSLHVQSSPGKGCCFSFELVIEQ